MKRGGGEGHRENGPGIDIRDKEQSTTLDYTKRKAKSIEK
jgi:hypothetical protein